MIQRLQDDDILKGLLAFAPFFLAISSFSDGLYVGLIASLLMLFIAPIVYFSCKFITLPQQRLAFVVIVSVSCILIIRMWLNAEAYSLIDKIGLFFPLLLMNSLALSMIATILSMPDFKSVMSKVLKIALATILFFVIAGLAYELLHELLIFTSPAGFLFLSGFLFAMVNVINKNKESKH